MKSELQTMDYFECELVPNGQPLKPNRLLQASKKVPSSHLGQVDFPARPVPFSAYLPNRQGPGKLSANCDFKVKE